MPERLKFRVGPSRAAEVVLVASFLMSVNSATVFGSSCSCRSPIPASAEGPGACQVIQENGKYCVVKFGPGTTGPQQEADFRKALKRYDLPAYDNSKAALLIDQTPIMGWNSGFLKDNLPPLFAVALWNTPAVSKLPSIDKLLHQTEFLNKITDHIAPKDPSLFTNPRHVQVPFGDFIAIVSPGCLQLLQGSFSVTVKSGLSPVPSGDCQASN